jgi:hypothetical protein
MKTIEFQKSPVAAPWRTPGRTRYEDLFLDPEYEARKMNFPSGETWFRIVPALAGSRGSTLRIHALAHPGGRHAKPLKTGSKSVFDVAYTWLNSHRPELLYCKANRDGFRLLSDPVIACWILVEEEGKMVARIVLASGYDGSRNGTVGLGYQLQQLIQKRDPDRGLASDPVDPENGLQVCVEKTLASGEKYPSYRLRHGQQAVPIQRYLDRMTDEEIDALCPLENVVRVIEPQHEWELLGEVIGAELRDKVQAAVGPVKSKPSLVTTAP